MENLTIEGDSRGWLAGAMETDSAVESLLRSRHEAAFPSPLKNTRTASPVSTLLDSDRQTRTVVMHFMPTPVPTSAARPFLSLCMIVKNESATLARCLGSAKGIVDEIIVVDTGSTDGTQAIVKEYGAQLIQSAWEHDFSRSRNQSLNAATGVWILVLDADEYLLPEDGLALRKLIAAHTTPDGRGVSAFNLVMQNITDEGRPGMLVHIARLFPNQPDIRFEWPIHEQVVTSLDRARVPVRSTDVKFIHTGYASPEKNRLKQMRNRDLLLAQIQSGRDVTPMTHFLLGGCYLDLDEPEAALRVYRVALQTSNLTGHESVARGAQVRIESCLLALGRAVEALAGMPADFDQSWHPERVALRAEAAVTLKHPDDARTWYEHVLRCTDTPQIPPYDLIQLKCDALLFLGSFWKARGNPALAVQLLRAALALKQDGKAFGPAELATLYNRMA